MQRHQSQRGLVRVATVEFEKRFARSGAGSCGEKRKFVIGKPIAERECGDSSRGRSCRWRVIALANEINATSLAAIEVYSTFSGGDDEILWCKYLHRALHLNSGQRARSRFRR